MMNQVRILFDYSLLDMYLTFDVLERFMHSHRSQLVYGLAIPPGPPAPAIIKSTLETMILSSGDQIFT